MEQEARAKMERYKNILDNRKDYLERPYIGYHRLMRQIKSEKNRKPFFLKMHERTRLCHPVFDDKKLEKGYRDTVNDIFQYFMEKYESYNKVVQIYERKRNEAELHLKQQQFKKEVEATRERLRKIEIEKELSQIDFTPTPVYADLLGIEKLAVL